MTDRIEKLDRDIFWKTVFLAFVDAIFPYVKRVVMLFALLVAIRDYLKVVASEDHTSQEIFDALGPISMALLIFLIVLPILKLLSHRLHSLIKNAIDLRFQDERDTINDLFLAKRRMVTFLFSFIIAISILQLFASSLAALTLVIVQLLNLVYIWAFNADVIPRRFKSSLFKYEFLDYFGFATYVTLLCLGFYLLDWQFSIDISHIFLFIMVPRQLIRAQKKVLKTIEN